jgi:chromosome segregation ATPase
MKIAVIILAIVLVVVGLIALNSHHQAQEQLARAHEQIVAQSNEVAVAQGQTETAQAEAAGVKTQLQSQAVHVTTLEKSVQTLTAEKTAAQQEAQQFKTRADTLQSNLVAEGAKLASAETEKTRLLGQLGGVSNQLVVVGKQLGDLEKSHAATAAELQALRDQQEALEMEKKSLVRQLNDLDALKAQIRLVRQERWKERIADWKRSDEAGSASGNHGLLFKLGQWQTASPAAQQ